MSGYTDCKCPNCFEIAISDNSMPEFCWQCDDAGCDGVGECQVEPEPEPEPECDEHEWAQKVGYNVCQRCGLEA